MATINVSGARENLSEAIETAKTEVVFLESHGHPVAVLLSPERHAELTAAFEEHEDVEAFDEGGGRTEPAVGTGDVRPRVGMS